MYTVTVPASQVVMTQPYLEDDGLGMYLRAYDAGEKLIPKARKIGDRFHILDGHHKGAICDIVSGEITLTVHEQPEDYDPKERGAYLVYTRWDSVVRQTFGTLPEFRAKQSPWLRTEEGVRAHLGVPYRSSEARYERAA